MVQRYTKQGCKYCEGYSAQAGKIYPPNDQEQTAFFYAIMCPSCHDPILIYRYHSEPSDKEIEEMIEWGKQTFPSRISDFERIHNVDHFSIELRYNPHAQIDLSKHKTLLKCTICSKLLLSSEMDASIDGLWFCKDCFAKLPHFSYSEYINKLLHEPSNLSKEEAQYEYIQMVDQDDESEEES